MKHLILGEDKRGMYIGDLAYKLSRTRSYSLRQGIGNNYRNLSASWMWKRKGGRLRIDLSKEPNPHMLIVGSSGYGKSTLLKRVLHEIEGYRMPAILLDAHNEHEGIIREVGGRVYDAVDHGINIFALDGLDVKERADALARLFADVY
ncbi:MAG: helicase HerA domain-containing protein, partial [Candidatus Micrarchaeia archaeon]